MAPLTIRRIALTTLCAVLLHPIAPEAKPITTLRALSQSEQPLPSPTNYESYYGGDLESRIERRGHSFMERLMHFAFKTGILKDPKACDEFEYEKRYNCLAAVGHGNGAEFVCKAGTSNDPNCNQTLREVHKNKEGEKYKPEIWTEVKFPPDNRFWRSVKEEKAWRMKKPGYLKPWRGIQFWEALKTYFKKEYFPESVGLPPELLKDYNVYQDGLCSCMGKPARCPRDSLFEYWRDICPADPEGNWNKQNQAKLRAARKKAKLEKLEKQKHEKTKDSKGADKKGKDKKGKHKKEKRDRLAEGERETIEDAFVDQFSNSRKDKTGEPDGFVNDIGLTVNDAVMHKLPNNGKPSECHDSTCRVSRLIRLGWEKGLGDEMEKGMARLLESDGRIQTQPPVE